MSRKLLILCLALVGYTTAHSAPNIIFILCDDLGYGDLYCLHQHTRDNGEGGGTAGDGLINGSEEAFIYTPNLDRMAAEGAKLTRHYTSAPVCAPARGSLLQGRDQGHANIRDNSFDKVISNNHTLGTVLKTQGYFTACVGKWGVGGGSAPYAGHPNSRGFDYFYGYMEHLFGHQHYPGNGGTVYEQASPVTSGLDHAYTTDLWTAKAKEIIRDRHASAPETPFFIYLAYDAPHAQLQVPTQAYPAGQGTSGGLSWPLNTNSGSDDSWIHPDYAALGNAAARHATMVRRLDDGVGDLLQTLRDLEIADNTLVVFTSDNGTHNESGSGGSVAHNPRNFDSFGVFEGIKRDEWEGGIRMPAFAWWPGKIGDNNAATPALDSKRPSAFWDWMPTFAEAAGAVPPAWSSGVSLLPELTGEGTQQDKGYLYFEYNVGSNTPSYAEFPNHGGARRDQMQAIFLDDTDGKRYKGVRYAVTNHAADDFLIYDVDADPGESNNLAPAKPALQQKMKDKVLGVRLDGDYNRAYLTAEQTPAVVLATVPGLDYRAFTGSWPWVPETSTQTPAASGDCVGFDLSKRTRDDDIALEFTGFINLPADGTYTFQLACDPTVTNNQSGAMLWIHEANVIDDDFDHDGSNKSGSMRLKAGLHPIRLLYKHASGSHALSLKYSGPGIALQDVPPSALLREGAPEPVPVANPDQTSISSGESTTIAVLANDSDDGLPEALSIVSLGIPRLGEASLMNNEVIYIANEGAYGLDRFPYLITDGENVVQGWIGVRINGGTDLLFSDFNAHGSVDNATSFTGITWIANGITSPPSTIPLSSGAAVQTSGAGENANRLAVARNIDTQGPWSIDIPFTATSNLTASDATFDYQFISGSGGNQGNAHPDSGIVTISILNASATTTLSTVTLAALGSENTASNTGTGVLADFPDINLTAGTSYVLRFHVTSNANLGNNFALDNLALHQLPAAPVITTFSASPSELANPGTATLSWQTSGAGRISISDGAGELASFTTTADGQAALDSGMLVLPALALTTTFHLTATRAEDGSGTAAESSLTLPVASTAPGSLAVTDFGPDNGDGSPFLTINDAPVGFFFQLFRSPDLIEFSPLGNPVPAPLAGTLPFLDPDPTSHPRMFYQVRQVP